MKQKSVLAATVDVFVREAEGGTAGGINALPRRLFIKNMIVDAAFRRQGYAKKLLARVEEYAQELDIQNVSLEVLADNDGAMRLYESQGYRYRPRSPVEYIYKTLRIGKITMNKELV